MRVAMGALQERNVEDVVEFCRRREPLTISRISYLFQNFERIEFVTSNLLEGLVVRMYRRNSQMRSLFANAGAGVRLQLAWRACFWAALDVLFLH